jgi:hypothetical protein
MKPIDIDIINHPAHRMYEGVSDDVESQLMVDRQATFNNHRPDFDYTYWDRVFECIHEGTYRAAAIKYKE